MIFRECNSISADCNKLRQSSSNPLGTSEFKCLSDMTGLSKIIKLSWIPQKHVEKHIRVSLPLMSARHSGQRRRRRRTVNFMMLSSRSDRARSQPPVTVGCPAGEDIVHTPSWQKHRGSHQLGSTTCGTQARSHGAGMVRVAGARLLLDWMRSHGERRAPLWRRRRGGGGGVDGCGLGVEDNNFTKVLE